MLWISHLPAASLFLLLLLCFPGQNGGENEQSTDTVSVWEGESISITCSRSEHQLGMHLTTIIQPINVLYVSGENTNFIHPDFDSRLTYSREGSNLKITLHCLRESDSNIYQCSNYILNKDHPKRLNGKKTIIVVKAIAVPSGSPAGMTQDSSSVKMHVIVYYCKDCDISICKLKDYEGFDKIGETRKKTFSNEIIKLETNETNINMCFQQENTPYRGIYSIWWEKDVGMGDACGIVDYRASSENGGGNIAKICCAAEINHVEPSHSLVCYTSGEEPPTRKPTDEEDPGTAQPPMGVGKSTGIIAAILILGVCAAALITFCVQRNRNGQAAGNKNLVPDIEDFVSFGKKTSK